MFVHACDLNNAIRAGHNAKYISPAGITGYPVMPGPNGLSADIRTRRGCCREKPCLDRYRMFQGLLLITVIRYYTRLQFTRENKMEISSLQNLIEDLQVRSMNLRRYL